MAIGKRSEELAGLHAERGVSSSAFITAWNPFSKRVEDAENLAKNASLRQELQAAGFEFIPGRGVNPQGLWPPEASFLILGIDRAEAARIGRRYRQNAIVYAGENAVPELVLLR